MSAVLWREGLGKRARLTPVEPPNRYERRAAGELIHVDIEKLGRIVVPGHAVTSNRRTDEANRRPGAMEPAARLCPSRASEIAPRCRARTRLRRSSGLPVPDERRSGR